LTYLIQNSKTHEYFRSGKWTLDSGWAEGACLSVLFLPSIYVTLRRWLHRAKLVRCDWIGALRAD